MRSANATGSTSVSAWNGAIAFTAFTAALTTSLSFDTESAPTT